MDKTLTMTINACNVCPYFELDATSRAYETAEIDQKVWADAAYGKRAICLVLMESMRQDDAGLEVLPKCPLDDIPCQGQALRRIAEAVVGAPVLGVWKHHSRTDYLSCYRHKSGEWYLTHDTAMTTPMRPPDGFLDLPVVEMEEQGQ